MAEVTAPGPVTTLSGLPLEPVYGPEHVAGLDLKEAPGEFPYTRGIHPTMYRGRLWTMRLFSGFATPEETNRRYHYLLEQGQTGLSVACRVAAGVPGLPATTPAASRSGMLAGREHHPSRRH